MLTKLKEQLVARRATWDIVHLFGGNPSGAEQARMTAWRNKSEEYQASYIDTLQALSDMDALADDPDVLAITRRYGKAVPDSKSGIQRPKFKTLAAPVAMAASLSLAIVVGYSFLSQPVDKGASGELYITRVGEQKTINLGDGSVITLNTGTQLRVVINDQTRRIDLEHGEAYFAVANDPSRPFVVDVGMRSISVLGTEFNVLKSPEQFTLAVMEGKVAVHQTDEPVSVEGASQLVEAGTVAEFDAVSQQLLAYQPENIKQLQSWRDGTIRFDEEPLAKVIQALNRYSTKKILIEDSGIMDLEVYAVVRVGSIDAALQVLEATMPVKVTRHFDRIVISEK